MSAEAGASDLGVSASASPPRPRATHWTLLVGGVAALLLLLVATRVVLDLCARFGDRELWDDSYMFVRYADHLLEGRGVRWNAGDPPTFGLTSLGFLAPVALLRWFTPESDHASVLLAGYVGGGALLLLLGTAVWRAVRAAPQRLAIAGLIAWLLCGRPGLTFHFATGMDTTFALAGLTAFLLLVQRSEQPPSRRRMALIGGSAALLFVVRPDLLLFSGAVLAAWLVTPPPGTPRRLVVTSVGVAAGGLALQLGVAQLYFGTALPLPFYAKATGLYGPTMQAAFANTGAEQLALFAADYWPLMVIAVSPCLLGWRRLRAIYSSADLGLLLAVAGFIAYYRWCVLQVMPYGQRFYYPTLPVLALLATKSLAGWSTLLQGAPRPRLAAMAGTLLLSSWLGWETLGSIPLDRLGTSDSADVSVNDSSNRDADDHLDRGDPTDGAGGLGWRALLFATAELPSLPDDLVLAASDLGYLGQRARHKRVIDLAALHDTDFALHGFSAERLLAHDRPDLIYVPHRYLAETKAALFGHPLFQQDYELFTRAKVRCSGVALRRSSPHYARLRALLEPWIIKKS